ncbi:MAG: hypothetical protein NC218_03260 [Acetobacter sp.]|nr:hypothetical protein [Acetobacter sp.]
MRVFEAQVIEERNGVGGSAIVVVFESQEEYAGYMNGTAEWGENLAKYGLEDNDISWLCGKDVFGTVEVGAKAEGDLATYILTKEIEKEDDEVF